jgi:hAT family C-terminal dimerisation region
MEWSTAAHSTIANFLRKIRLIAPPRLSRPHPWESDFSDDINPHEWWIKNKTKFPNVAAVARRFLGIPTTSVASERIFFKVRIDLLR